MGEDYIPDPAFRQRPLDAASRCTYESINRSAYVTHVKLTKVIFGKFKSDEQREALEVATLSDVVALGQWCKPVVDRQRRLPSDDFKAYHIYAGSLAVLTLTPITAEEWCAIKAPECEYVWHPVSDTILPGGSTLDTEAFVKRWREWLHDSPGGEHGISEGMTDNEVGLLHTACLALRGATSEFYGMTD